MTMETAILGVAWMLSMGLAFWLGALTYAAGRQGKMPYPRRRLAMIDTENVGGPEARRQKAYDRGVRFSSLTAADKSKRIEAGTAQRGMDGKLLQPEFAGDYYGEDGFPL